MDDMANSRARLKRLLRRVQFPQPAALDLEAADVRDLLRILHFALLDFSRAVAAAVQRHGFDLYGKTDARFVDCAFRLLRDAFKYFPALSPAQFLSAHHRRRKLELVADVLQLVLAEHDESERLARRQAAVWSQPKEATGAAPRVESHLLPAPAPAQSRPPAHAAQVLRLLQSSKRATNARRAENRDAHARGEQRSEARGDAARSQEQLLQAPVGREDGDGGGGAGGGDVTRADSSPRQSAQQCACASSTAELVETLAALSSQVAALSSAFMAKISSVEERLSCLEAQVQSLATLPDRDNQGDSQVDNLVDSQVDSQRGTHSNDSHSEAASRLRLQLEARSWPPKPPAFARP